MIESNSPLLREAITCLNFFKKARPGVRACISGGFLRDICTGNYPKDCDVFVEFPTDADSKFFDALRLSFGEIEWMGENLAEYNAMQGVSMVGTGGEIGKGGCRFNIILLNTGIDPVADAKTHDFGACQVWTEGGEIHATNAFFRDIAQRTFTLEVCEDMQQFERSMRRWERLSAKFPGWNLVVPPRYSPFANQSMGLL